MSYYEKAAEEEGYYHFKRREIGYSAPHFHGAVEFIFIEKGKLDAVINGEKFTVNEGQGVFVDCFSVHAYTENGDNTGYVLLGDKEIFNRYFNLLGGVPKRFFDFDDFETLSYLYNVCTTDFKNKKVRNSVFDGAVGVILGTLCQKTEFTNRTDTGSSLVTDILTYAEDHVSEDLSLSFIAKRFGYSKEHLSRLLHKYLSENWNRYTGRLRAKKVRVLMEKYPKESVLKLAFDCGFESSNTFYRAYRNTFGCVPKIHE